MLCSWYTVKNHVSLMYLLRKNIFKDTVKKKNTFFKFHILDSVNSKSTWFSRNSLLTTSSSLSVNQIKSLNDPQMIPNSHIRDALTAVSLCLLMYFKKVKLLFSHKTTWIKNGSYVGFLWQHVYELRYGSLFLPRERKNIYEMLEVTWLLKS